MDKRLSLLAFFAFLLLIQSAAAISLGTVVKNDVVSIKDDEGAIFTILFWNVENNTYNVNLELKDSPPNWTVIFQPKSFILNSSSGDENIVLPYMNESAKALAAKILVEPKNAEAGRYYLIITAIAGSPEKGLSFYQEREFRLAVDVTGTQFGPESTTTISDMTGDAQPSGNNPIMPTYQTGFSYLYIYVMVFICIFVVSVIIYKYA